MALSQTRKEIMAEIIAVMKTAKSAGCDGYAIAREKYPSVPITVMAECDVMLDAEEVEAWWVSMERTIEGEIVRNALAAKT